MYESIMEQIPTTIKHEERLAEINRLLIDSGIGQLPSLAAFARIRAESEADMIAALRAKYPNVARYTMLPEERITERLSYLAMDIESEIHTTTTAAGVIVLTWDTFSDAYIERMGEYIADIESLEPDEDEIAAQAGEMAYDRCKDDQA